jgi:hypothetical protein
MLGAGKVQYQSSRAAQLPVGFRSCVKPILTIREHDQGISCQLDDNRRQNASIVKQNKQAIAFDSILAVNEMLRVIECGVVDSEGSTRFPL